MSGARTRGRPKLSPDARRVQTNFRTDPALRAQLEASAAAHGRLLTEEIERLLRLALGSAQR
jgi:hypothetical protein